MISLRKALDDYLALRRSLGWELVLPAAALRQFVDFLERQGAPRLTRDAAVRWATERRDVRPAMWARRLSFVRHFAEYLRGIDPKTEIPPAGLLPHRFPRHQPFIYTDTDVRALISAARSFPEWTPQRRSTISTLIGLLAATGLRSGEAFRLDDADVDYQRRLLVVRRSKFRKSRLVPVHPSMLAVLREYQRRRRIRLPRTHSASLFVWDNGGRLHRNYVRPQFVQVCARVGIRRLGARHGPRLHDFRHSFVVRSLMRWYRTDADVEVRMAALATYVGHSSVQNTYWYISAVPELLALAGRRLERTLGDLP